MSSGLLPMSRQYVHLSADRETAERVGARRGKPVVLVVASGAMHREGHEFRVSANGVWLTAHVPPRFL
ncbi:RNA 2'-phosphotransferase [Nonomuraea sp. NPDC050556]|uniref:RNA 2'-phosphotransferase n=1 Tax=Nonomuraea sp. NPDC050556 TaxID=3364369 RepID=UPI0037BB1FD0